MKPLVIRFQAFGPYRNEEIVDFEKLSQQGLFLICGETGSGKTTLLDAMTFALYGKSSGGMRDQLEAMRCKQSAWGTDTYVCYDFELQQKIYRFERKLECKKVKLSASQNVYVKNEEGVFEPIFENCKEKDINAKAKELIGLDYDQFRQVIILPQGQFEKLLTSNSDEKEKILVSIFGVNKWQKIANYIYDAASVRRNALLKIKEQLELRLRDEGCSTVDEFEKMIESLQNELAAKENAYQKADYDRRRKQLEEELELGKQFVFLHELERKRNQLESKKVDFDAQKEKLEIAEQAEEVKGFLNQFEDAKQNYLVRHKNVQSLEERVPQIEHAAKNAKENLEFHLQKKTEVEIWKQEIIRLEEKRPYYEGLQEKENDLKTQTNVYEKKLALLRKAEHESEKEQTALQKVSEDYKEIRRIYNLLSEGFLASITGTLAAKLESGAPCPVCGSREHPQKASLSENAVTEREVKQKEQEMHLKFEEIEKCQKKYQKALQEKEVQEHACAEQKQMMVLTEKEVQNAKENLADGIETIQTLETIIMKYRSKIEAYQSASQKLESILQEKMNALTELQAKLAMAKDEMYTAEERQKAARNILQDALQKTIFNTSEEVKKVLLTQQEMQKIRNAYAQYQAEIKHLEEESCKMQDSLQGKTEPDLAICESELKKITEEKEKYLSESARMQLMIAQKQEKRSLIQKMSEEYAASWAQAESDWALAKNLRGDTGIGLQRYVLGVMFSSVITAANKMLEKVHGGRYRLFRSDEKGQGSNKKGLELKVFDSFSKEGDEGRSVKTLSGGEKFLVSLALSIGMSTVAQRSGTHLDAMFVDEGFGSLDQNSIEDALEVLASIQKANGTVGIISHVQILQDNIPVKLEIKKSREGSRIISNIG